MSYLAAPCGDGAAGWLFAGEGGAIAAGGTAGVAAVGGGLGFAADAGPAVRFFGLGAASSVLEAGGWAGRFTTELPNEGIAPFGTAAAEGRFNAAGLLPFGWFAKGFAFIAGFPPGAGGRKPGTGLAPEGMRKAGLCAKVPGNPLPGVVEVSGCAGDFNTVKPSPTTIPPSTT